MSPVLKCLYKIIEGWCLASDSTNMALKHGRSVLFALTRYPRDELKNADRHDVVGIWSPLVFTFSI